MSHTHSQLTDLDLTSLSLNSFFLSFLENAWSPTTPLLKALVAVEILHGLVGFFGVSPSPFWKPQGLVRALPVSFAAVFPEVPQHGP